MTTHNVKLRLCLEFLTNINVGSSYPVKTRADVPVQKIIKDGRVTVFISGSTIKGVLRSAMIKAAPLLGFDSHPRVKPEILSSSDDIVNQLLGRPEGYSKIIVEPLYIDADNLVVIPHISIEDKYGIVKEGSLYMVEYIPIGTKCSTNLYASNINLDEARLLFASIAELNYTTLGKGGLAKFTIDVSNSEIPDDLIKDLIIKELVEVLGGNDCKG